MGKTVSMERVDQALSTLEKLQHETDEFEVKDTYIEIRTLSGEELEKVYERANPIFQRAMENENQFSLENWMNCIRLETMTYSIIKIDNIDLTGVEFLEDAEGSKKQKHAFLREKLKDWDRAIINVCFQKFKDLEIRADEQAKEGVEFEDQDLDEQIEEKERELAELRAKKADKATEEEIEETSFSKMSQDDLKEAIFSKSDEIELTDQNEEPSESLREEPQQSEPVYVDEDGNPLSDEEVRAVKEFEQRQQQNQEPQDMSDAAARKAQKRPRLNQQNPQVQKGSQQQNQQQTSNLHERRKQSRKDLPMAPGYEDYEPGVLSPDKNGDGEQNNKPDPTLNPNFKGNQS